MTILLTDVRGFVEKAMLGLLFGRSDPRDAEALAKLMAEFMEGNLQFQKTEAKTPEQPFVDSWPALLELLVQDTNF